MRNSVVRQCQLLKVGATRSDDVEQRGGHVIIDHAQDAHATTQQLRGGGYVVCENGCYLVVVQTSFF